MSSSPWQVFFHVGHYANGRLSALEIRQRTTRIVPDLVGRQALWLPVHPMDAISEALPLLDPIYAHYAAQWPKIMSDYVSIGERQDGGRGFHIRDMSLPEQIADPALADELDVIAWRNIPPETRREWEEGPEGELPHALTIDPRVIAEHELDVCVHASEVGIEPYRGGGEMSELTRHPCDCCGNLTLKNVPEDICPVCFWADEEDPQYHANDPSWVGPNAVSLSEARSNYARFGVSEPRFEGHVRRPRPEELPPPG
jgi:Cysteine-rich CPCC